MRAHESIAASIEDDGLLGTLYGRISHAYWYRGQPDEGLEYGSKSLALCEKAGDAGGVAFDLNLIRYLRFMKGEFQPVFELKEAALKACAASPNLRVYMWTQVITGWTH